MMLLLGYASSWFFLNTGMNVAQSPVLQRVTCEAEDWRGKREEDAEVEFNYINFFFFCVSEEFMALLLIYNAAFRDQEEEK